MLPIQKSEINLKNVYFVVKGFHSKTVVGLGVVLLNVFFVT